MYILFCAQRIIPDMVSIGCLWGRSMTWEEGSFSTPFVLLNFAASGYITCSKLNYLLKKQNAWYLATEKIQRTFANVSDLFSCYILVICLLGRDTQLPKELCLRTINSIHCLLFPPAFLEKIKIMAWNLSCYELNCVHPHECICWKS